MNAVKTVLFVENDPVALTMYQNRLQREGFYVETAQDGLAALKYLSKSTPDVVVLDLMLPRFSGAEVFKFMRKDGRLKSAPVVIFSNAAMTDWPQDLDVGTTQCLPKTESTFPQLLQAIRELMTAAPVAPDLPSPEPAAAQTSTATSTMTRPVSRGRPDFVRDTLAEIPKLHELCLAYIKTPAADSSRQHLTTLHGRVHTLSADATQVGCTRVAMLTSAFGALLSEIMNKPSWATPSILQTMAQAVDCLRFLLRGDDVNSVEPAPRARVLAVDDDPVCNHVMVTTLKRANLETTSLENPLAALDLLQKNRFDLVLLDVNMPDLTGFEVCVKLRQFPHCKTIPVIFVTAFNNFENRKQSVLSGGDDFITKPISPLELALKVTIHLLKAQVKRGAAPQPEIEPEPVPIVISRETPLPSTPTPINQNGSGEMKDPTPSLTVPTTESHTSGPEAINPFLPPPTEPRPAELSPGTSPPIAPPRFDPVQPTVESGLLVASDFQPPGEAASSSAEDAIPFTASAELSPENLSAAAHQPLALQPAPLAANPEPGFEPVSAAQPPTGEPYIIEAGSQNPFLPPSVSEAALANLSETTPPSAEPPPVTLEGSPEFRPAAFDQTRIEQPPAREPAAADSFEAPLKMASASAEFSETTLPPAVPSLSNQSQSGPDGGLIPSSLLTPTTESQTSDPQCAGVPAEPLAGSLEGILPPEFLTQTSPPAPIAENTPIPSSLLEASTESGTSSPESASPLEAAPVANEPTAQDFEDAPELVAWMQSSLQESDGQEGQVLAGNLAPTVESSGGFAEGPGRTSTVSESVFPNLEPPPQAPQFFQPDATEAGMGQSIPSTAFFVPSDPVTPETFGNGFFTAMPASSPEACPPIPQAAPQPANAGQSGQTESTAAQSEAPPALPPSTESGTGTQIGNDSPAPPEALAPGVSDEATQHESSAAQFIQPPANLSVTESAASHAAGSDSCSVPTTAAPEICPPPAAPEAPQSAAPAQLNQREDNPAQSVNPAGQFQPVTESGANNAVSSEPTNAPMSAAPEICPQTVGQEASPPATETASPAGNSPAQSITPAAASLPAIESALDDDDEVAADSSSVTSSAVSEPGPELVPLPGAAASIQTSLPDHSATPSTAAATMFVPAPAASVARDLAVANPPAAGASPNRETETVGQMLNRQQTFEKIVIEVARIIFGENDLTEIKLRLVRIALERYTVQEILTGPGGV